MGRFFQIFISIIPHPGRQEHEVIILLKVRPVGNEVPGRREHKEVRITLGVPQQEIMNSSQLSTFFLQLLERFRKGLINDHGVGEVVRELHRIYNRESHNIPLNEKDLWSIQRDLLNGSYEFSPFKKVVDVTFPSFSGHPILFMTLYCSSPMGPNPIVPELTSSTLAIYLTHAVALLFVYRR